MLYLLIHLAFYESRWQMLQFLVTLYVRLCDISYLFLVFPYFCVFGTMR